MLGRLRHLLGRAAAPLLGRRGKGCHELRYWRERKAAEGNLFNHHYVPYYTEHFGLSTADYAGKWVLDIGCGPRGSLEWATMAARRVGIDPLAKEYLKLGADKHQMEYVAVPAETMPFEARSFDIVCSFNSLDHVDDVNRVIDEIKRVAKPGGMLLLLVEINHPPTSTEPHALGPELVRRFEPEFRCERMAVYRPVPGGLYDSIERAETVPDPFETHQVGWLSARFRKTT